MTSLRARLLVAFLAVGLAPTALLAVRVVERVSRAFDEAARRRLLGALDAARQRLTRLASRAEQQLLAVASVDLPATPAGADEATLAEALGSRRDLAALEILTLDGRVLSSRHWPAGFGLPDANPGFPGDRLFRIEKAAAGYGAEERLALMPERPARFRGQRVLLRGGAFLDAEILGELSVGTQTSLGIYDAIRGRWHVPPGSPLADWSKPVLGVGSGETQLADRPWRWAGSPLAPGLFVVAAVPSSDLDRVLLALRHDTVVAGLLALTAAVVAALALSGRLSRPIRELAAGARRVARGDLERPVVVAGTDEIAELAQAFSAMTEDLRTSRERLVQAERVTAWREMARRLAHELKNPIFPIQVSLDTLGRALDRDPARFAALFRESSETIQQELRSLRRIVDEFSDFARMPRPTFAAVSLNTIAEQTLALYRDRAGAVSLETDLAAGLATLPGDRDLLARAAGNLVANALEAMPEGGRLRLTTRATADAQALDISDTGPGLVGDQRTRLFTPYFTTKAGGTGLGLAIVQGIVSDHGGRVEVSSVAGQGTTFTLLLPSRSS